MQFSGAIDCLITSMFIIRTSKYFELWKIFWNIVKWYRTGVRRPDYYYKAILCWVFATWCLGPFPGAPEFPCGELPPPFCGLGGSPVPTSHQCPRTDYFLVLPSLAESGHLAWLIHLPWDLKFGARNTLDLEGRQSAFVHYMKEWCTCRSSFILSLFSIFIVKRT